MFGSVITGSSNFSASGLVNNLEFNVARCDVESLGKLDKIIEKGTDKYSYVFIDEAHRFRNSGTDSFTQLHQICRDKKKRVFITLYTL